MNEFYEKWRSDNKYRAKIKLFIYVLFVVIVSIYALSINEGSSTNTSNTVTDNKIDTPKKVIDVSEEYSYTTNVTINGVVYKYYGEKNKTNMIITKENDNEIMQYIYQDNNYYILLDDSYIKTTRDEVYDVVNYNYINLDSINTYLSKAVNNNNDQYLVYLKDVILGNDSSDYFVILVRDNTINIDYTPLIKQIDNSIQEYEVDIKIEKKD